MLVPALTFAWRYPLLGNTRRLTDIGLMSGYERGEFVLFVAGLTVLFTLYVLALREVRRHTPERALPVVFAVAGSLALVMIFMYPTNAIDIFIYAVRSRLLTTYGVDPIAVPPSAFPDDPWVPLAGGWVRGVSPYGPLWNLIAAPVTLVAGDRVGVALWGFKLMAAASLLAGGWIIARAHRAMASPDAAAGALLYLWNPLVLWEGVGNGHNDVVLSALLLLAMLAWTRRQEALVVPLLVLATLVKYVTVLLLPLAAISLGRRCPAPVRARVVLLSLLLSLGAVTVAFAPFYDLAAVHQSIREQGGVILSSPLGLATVLPSLRAHFEVDQIAWWGKRVGGALMLAAMLVAAAALWHRPSRLARVSFDVLCAALLLATWNFRGWYLIWPVALAALLPLGWPAARMVAWTAGSMLGYVAFIWFHEWWWSGEAVPVLKAGVGIIFVPALVVILAEVVAVATRHKQATAPSGP